MRTRHSFKRIFQAVIIGILAFDIYFFIMSKDLLAQKLLDGDINFALEKLNKNSLWNWQYAVDKDSGLPMVLFGSISNIYKGIPQDVAQNFLYDHPEIFGLEDCFYNYVLKETIKNSYATYLIYIQTYKEIPIEKSYLLISVTNKNRISMVKAKMFNNIHININSQISEEMAYNIALDDARKDSFVEEPGNIELVILPHQDNFLLIWKVQFKTDRFGGKTEYIISSKGKIINKKRIRVNFLHNNTIEDNPLLKDKEIIKALNSLGNIHLKAESINLLKKICIYEKNNSKDSVIQSVITSDLNISGGGNLLCILKILLNNNLLDTKLYYKFKHDIYKKKDNPLIQDKNKIDEKPNYSPVNPIYANQINPPSPVSKSSFPSTQSDMAAIIQMQVQDFQNIITLLYKSFAFNITVSMQRWRMDILKIQQAAFLNSNLSLAVAKTAKKICDKWDQYIQS